MRVAGIAGGVGTTVVAAVLDAEDIGRDVENADLIVARNDYRCAKALLTARAEQIIVLIVEPQRALTEQDFTDVLGRAVIAVAHDPAVARADDAGLLHDRRRTIGLRHQLASIGATA